MLLSNAPSFNEYLNEEVDTLESSIEFDTDAQVQSKIKRYLELAEISTGAIKIENNTATKKTLIRVFNSSVSDLEDILGADDLLSSKVRVIKTNKKVTPEFNT